MCIAADVPTFESGEYRVTTSFGNSQALEKKVCLTDYADWFGSLRDDFKERGCNLVADGQEDSVYRYRLDCTNGTTGALAVTKLSESHFESRAEVESADCRFHSDDLDARRGDTNRRVSAGIMRVAGANGLRCALAPMLCGFECARVLHSVRANSCSVARHSRATR